MSAYRLFQRGEKWHAEYRVPTATRRRKIALSTDYDQSVNAVSALSLALHLADRGQSVNVQSIPPIVRERFIVDAKTLGADYAQSEHSSKPIGEHIEDWGVSMRGRVGAKHAGDSVVRVAGIADMRRWSRLDQISAAGLEQHVKSMVAPATANHYITAIRSFCKWCVAEGRMESNPVAHVRMLSVVGKRSRVRRALTRDEFARLIVATRRYTATVGGVTPNTRCHMYMAGALAGLRAGEVRRLRRRDVDLENATLHITEDSDKAGKPRVLSMHPDLRDAIERNFWRFGSPDDKLFTIPEHAKLSDIIRHDLKTAAIPDRDEQGRIVDFHALRHTFCTWLAQANVHPAVLVKMARHANLDTTMKYYTHIDIDDMASALGKLGSVTCESACSAVMTHE